MKTAKKVKSLKEIKADIWDLYIKKKDREVIVIPTNGSVTRNGLAVMGRGLALDASNLFPYFRKMFGQKLLDNGNVVQYFPNEQLIVFPVKSVWYKDAELSIIERSCQQLNMIATLYTFDNIYVPRVGCGNGNLDWREVKQIFEKYLDHRYTIVWNG
jgi:hypothetical protein